MNIDILLIHRMKLGDEHAIEQFIQKYYPVILRYCRLHISDSFYAEDITQDTFERFFRSLDCLQNYGKALNFLYVIAANACKDYYKKKKELLMEELPENVVDETDRLDEKIDIIHAVSQLPEDCREAVILHFFQGMKLKETADILHITLPLVKYRIQKSKKILADSLRKG